MTPSENPPISILLVDPFPDEVEMYAEFLRQQGFRTQVCDDARRAKIIATKTAPDVVVARLRQTIPGISGLDLARQLKADDRTRNLAIVILSASTQAADRQACMDAGCDKYITIPYGPKALETDIRQLVNRAGLQERAAGRRRVEAALRDNRQKRRTRKQKPQ